MKANKTPEMNFHDLMEAMPNGMAYASLVFDPFNKPVDFIFLGINRAFEQVTGLRRECWVGKNASDGITKQVKEEMNFARLLFQTVIREDRWTAEFHFTQQGKWCLITVAKFEKNFLGISLQDITAQKNLEAQVHGYQSHLQDLADNAGCCDITLQSGNLNDASFQRLRYLTFYDKLTGLYNRAFFDKELTRLDAEGRLPLSVIMGDVNGLKLTNDVFGHAAGDRLLQNVANILKKNFRDKEIIARWGGDEFSILLPGTTYENALKLIDRIKEKCEAAENDPIKPSIALGLATKTDPAQDLLGVLKDAEDSMYSNKLLGGKIVCRAIMDSFERIIQGGNQAFAEHCKRTSVLCEKFGKYLNLTVSELYALNKLSWFHDIGMVRIREDIIKKSDALSAREWLEIRKHPEHGYRIAQVIPEIAFISELILSHHEDWDGNGYPRKLKGGEIPKLSRVFFLIDTYDVLTHDRPFNTALMHGEAVDEIKRCAGMQFDPVLTKYFIDFIGKRSGGNGRKCGGD